MRQTRRILSWVGWIVLLPLVASGGGPPADGLVTTDSGLKYTDLAVGTGRQAELGDQATVHYTGWLADGRQFDSSLDRNEPFSFRVGAGQVIKGWDEGVGSMRVGGKRKRSSRRSWLTDRTGRQA